ncbi:MAG TPA: LysR substrate-binding domain-containing protein [Sphingomonas sp.]|nr:LysR substrate-binding domain-containing protein [Sphingomonas sp.]
MKASLAELEAVAAVARHGGFRAAARELGTSSSALSSAVAKLEERLSVRLFNRTTRSVTFSDAGERFVAAVTPALAAIDSAIAHAGEHSGQPSGTLRLNMALGAARMLMAPIILEYGRRFPNVDVEIVTEAALVDVIGQGFDAGVRLAEAVPADMVSVPIFRTLRLLVVGSPGYFLDHPRPVVPADLLHHRCIRFRLTTGRLYRWEFERHGEGQLIDVPGSLTLDETDLMLQAALDGAGLAYLSEHAVAEHVKQGRLITVLEEWSPPFHGLSLYFAQRRHMPARLRALIDLIKQVAGS